MMLQGYRSGHLRLLTGPWLPGELLGLPVAGRPPLAEPVTVEPPKDHTAELCVMPGAAFVRYADVDWINRRARLEIGVAAEAADDAELILKAALTHGFRVLNLHRVYGWVTPEVHPPTDLLEQAGLRPEARVPDGIWYDGRPVERQIWGAVRDV